MKIIRGRIWAIGLAGLLIGSTFIFHKARGAYAATPSKLSADVPMLDVIVQSPIAIVQYKDGDVDLLLEDIDDHPYGFVKGTSDCGLEEGRGVDYRIDFTSNEASTDIDPDKMMPDEVKIDNGAEPVNIDLYKRRLSAIRLPRPRQIIPVHLDGEGLTVYKPGGPISVGHSYPTSIALRYAVPVNAPIAVERQDVNSPCPLAVRALGNERLIYVGMGPAVEDTPGHPHAVEAFHEERDLLSPLQREIHYPKNRLRASDCKAPIILVTGADKGQQKQNK
jgi:hypothetical protein